MPSLVRHVTPVSPDRAPELADTVQRGGQRADPRLAALLGWAVDEPLAALTEQERAGAKVAILAGLAPEAVTDEQVATWRATDRRLSDHCTVSLLAYGAMTAVTHIEADIAATLAA